MVTTLEIAWAAGFIEGEGNFYGIDHRGTTVTVSACQVQKEPLERLERILGGRLTGPTRTTKTGKPIYRWSASGKAAAAIAMTLLPLLSPRRFDQAIHMLNIWKGARGHRNLQKTHCPKGHAYVEGNIYFYRKWRTCRQCTLDKIRKKRDLLSSSIASAAA